MYPFTRLIPSICLLSLAAIAVADEPRGKRLVATLQDERDAVPYSSIVSLDPAEELRYRMALASDLRADRIARQAAGGEDALVGSSSADASFEDVEVTLIQPNLDKRKIRPAADGTLELASLMPGVNVLVATGARAHGVQTLFVKMRADDELPPADDLFANQNGSDELPVMTLVSATEEEVLPVVESYAPRARTAELGELEDIKSDVTADDRSFEYRVSLSPDGILNGYLITLMSNPPSLLDTNIVLFRNGRPVARALTDRQGRFAFEGVEPDVYGIVAAGSAGYAAFGFEVIAEPGLVQLPNSEGRQFVSRVQQDGYSELPIVLVPPPMVPDVVEAIEEAYDGIEDDDQGLAFGEFDAVPAPGLGPMGGFGGYGGGPGMGGGGGGFGGGGGGGSLAGLAAVGGLIAAAAASSNDDNAIGLPQEASPVLPTTFTVGGSNNRGNGSNGSGGSNGSNGPNGNDNDSD